VLIVHGVYHWRPRVVAFRNDYCIRCGGVSVALRRRTVDVLHIFFLPVLPLGVWKRWHCVSCGSDPHARTRTYRSVKWAGTLLLAFLAVLGWMASTDRQPHDQVFIWTLRIGAVVAFVAALRHTIKSPPDVDLAARLREVPPLAQSVCAVCGAGLAFIGGELRCSDCGATWSALEAA
jgi:hypothetical protein